MVLVNDQHLKHSNANYSIASELPGTNFDNTPLSSGNLPRVPDDSSSNKLAKDTLKEPTVTTKTSGMQISSDKSKSDQVWIDCIAENSEKLPILNSLLYTSELYLNRDEKLRTYIRKVVPLTSIATAYGILIALIASKKLSFLDGPVNKRKFLTTIGIGSLLTFGGRYADVSSTKWGMLEFRTLNETMSSSSNFSKLPESLQKKLTCTPQELELNPIQDRTIETILEPYGCTKVALAQTAFVSILTITLLGCGSFISKKWRQYFPEKEEHSDRISKRISKKISATLALMFRKLFPKKQQTDKPQKKLEFNHRRNFFTISTALFFTSGALFVNNLEATDSIQKAQGFIDKELATLMKLMDRKRLTQALKN